MALIGWWPLNGNLKDHSINNTEATLKGTVNIVDGLYKKAYSVETASGAIQTNVGAGINPGEGFSISIWAKSDNASGNRLIFATNNGSNQRYYISQHSSKWEFAVMNITWNNAHSKIPVVADRWTHLVLTTIGGTTSFYVDGEFSHSKEHGSFILPSNFNIGNHGPGSESDSYRFRGSLQDARIYDHALSTKEIKELYKANILSYSFDRNEEIVFDNSGYLNNGTLGSSVVQENNYIVFNGNSNSRIVGEKIFEDNNNQIWTVMATIELDSNTKAGQYLNNFNLGNRIVYSGANGKALLYINSGGNDSYTYSTGAIPNGEKIHIAFVLNTYTQRCQFYLNGSLYGTSVNYESTDVPNGFASTHIIGQGFEGKMYDFKIYARDLTSDEIAEEYKTKISLDKNGNLYVDELVESEYQILNVNPSGGNHTSAFGLLFQPEENMYIKSAMVRPYFTGDLTMYLHDDSTKERLYTKTVSVTSGSNQRVDVGFKVKKGKTYWWGRESGGLMRTTAGLPEDTKPFNVIGGDTLSKSNHGNQYYYFFAPEYIILTSFEKNKINSTEFIEINNIDESMKLKIDTLEIKGELKE